MTIFPWQGETMGIQILQNGREGSPIGFLPGPDGRQVPVLSDSAVDLMAAALEAAGDCPAPPVLGLGGQLVPTGRTESGKGNTYQYDPTGDNENKDQVAIYQARVSVHNTRINAIKEMVIAIVSRPARS